MESNYIKRVLYYSDMILAILKIVNKKLDISEKKCIIDENIRKSLLEDRKKLLKMY
jgi:CRISPR/Cas system-associated exonuclease Cas4 (RecB family)